MIHSIIRHIESLPISPLGIIISRAMSTKATLCEEQTRAPREKNSFYRELEYNRKLENIKPNPNITIKKKKGNKLK